MDPLRYAFVALQDNHWSEVQQPIVDGSIPAKLGEVVNGVINNLLNKIPFLAPSSPNPAPSGIGGIVSNLVGGLTGSAGDVVKVRCVSNVTWRTCVSIFGMCHVAVKADVTVNADVPVKADVVQAVCDLAHRILLVVFRRPWCKK